MQYKGIDVIAIPSGKGDYTPAAIVNKCNKKFQVICLETNWLLTVKESDTTAFSGELTDNMKNIINSRLP